MTDSTPIEDQAWAFTEPVCACALADSAATARNTVRLRSDDALSADIPMLRHSDAVPNVSDLLCHLG